MLEDFLSLSNLAEWTPTIRRSETKRLFSKNFTVISVWRHFLIIEKENIYLNIFTIVRKLFFKGFQIRQEMHTVDAAEN